MVDNLEKIRIKSLLLKGFGVEEIKSMLNISDKKIKELSKDIKVTADVTENSIELYSELQKDLSKLVLTELNKSSRDSSVILNAIKLQAELQEKKLIINKGNFNLTTKVNKDYIYTRDEEINKLKQQGSTDEELAKKFNISLVSIKQATDRFNLNLPEELKALSPAIITETMGLDKNLRIKILGDALNNNLKRKDIREMVNKIKNTR